jgi:uncharacterized phiE125 gp8 family phage protein
MQAKRVRRRPRTLDGRRLQAAAHAPPLRPAIDSRSFEARAGGIGSLTPDAARANWTTDVTLSEFVMTAILLAGPSVEPITLAEAKTHLRVDTAAEDTLIQSLIMASRLHIEAALDVALITQSWRIRRDAWPSSGIIDLPLRPVQSVSSIKVYSDEATSDTLDTTAITLDGHANPARIIWNSRSPVPTSPLIANGVEINLVAGFGDAEADVPQPIRHALLLLVAHWYEHRDPVEIGAIASPIPLAVSGLLAPYRRRHL